MFNFLLIVTSLFGIVLVGILILKIIKKRVYIWGLDYVIWETKSFFIKKIPKGAAHLIFFITDHFEPQFGRVAPEVEIQRVNIWCERYINFASRFKDSDGRAPQHTWFYPYDEKNDYCLSKINDLVRNGYGEIEFHLHHSGDTEETFYLKINEGLKWFNRFGAMISKERKIRFGFIHGMFALANSDPRYCGVNNEIKILESLGCYADFTFPAIGTRSQPKIINKIYYPIKSGEQPKSYDKGFEMQVGRPQKELVLFPGPISFDFTKMRFDDGRVEPNFILSSGRIQNWLHANIHVKGKPEWIFIKLYTHSARERTRETFFSSHSEEFYRWITSEADRGEFHLHFVTAREAFNIAKAAGVGKKGKDPQEYLDYDISPPVNRL